jgi:DNA-binding IclR family transcriptional regulator
MRLVKGLLNRCLELLELLAVDAQWRRLSDISAALHLPKGPLHRLLSELIALGWVEQEPQTERYRLTLRLALLGQQYLRNTSLPGVVQPVLDEVARRSRELVRLTVVQGDALHWLAASQGAPTGLMYQPGFNGPLVLHTTANGKAWLATMDDAAATRLARRGGLGRTDIAGELWGPRALRDTAALRAELAATRARGYGLAVEEAERGVKAIAVVVRAHDDGAVLGTLSIAGPLVRMGPERDAQYHDLLRQAASTLALAWPREHQPRAANHGGTR